MAEYINREELFKDIEDSVRFSTRNGVSAELRGAHKIVDRIRSAPAADVVEVVYGEWVKTDKGQKCSNCNCLSSLWDNNLKSVYCPWCGAKMDVERRSK